MLSFEFGLGRAVPDAVKNGWGARLIFPDDLLWDRRSMVGDDMAERKALAEWLQAHWATAMDISRGAAKRGSLTKTGYEEVVLFKDEVGVIVACPQASGGYLYVAAWLHRCEPDRQPAESFQPPKAEAP